MGLYQRLKAWVIEKKIKKNNPGLTFFLNEASSVSGIRNISVENGVRLGPGNIISASGGLHIGANVITAPNVVIWTQNHDFFNAESLPYGKKVISKKVVIGNNCWIGEGAKIAPGVTVGEGVIVAMGAVVFQDVPDFSIVKGNPGVAHPRKDDISIYRSLDIEKDSYLIKKMSKK